jgi:hypothetical protein
MNQSRAAGALVKRMIRHHARRHARQRSPYLWTLSGDACSKRQGPKRQEAVQTKWLLNLGLPAGFTGLD